MVTGSLFDFHPVILLQILLQGLIYIDFSNENNFSKFIIVVENSHFEAYLRGNYAPSNCGFQCCYCTITLLFRNLASN